MWHERTNRNKFQNRNENRRNSWQLKEQNNDMQQKTITKQERNEKANQFKTFPSKEIDIGCTDCSSVESKGTIILLILLINLIYYLFVCLYLCRKPTTLILIISEP